MPVFGVGEHDGTALLRHAVHPGPGPGRGARRAEAAAGRRPAGVGRRPTDGRPRPAGGDVSAADVARSLLTGRFDAGEPTGDSHRAGRRRGEHRVAREPRRLDAAGPARRLVRARPPRRSRCRARAETATIEASEADLLAERGPDRRAGGRGPGLRPQPGDPAPRHQAVEPAAGHAGAPSGSPTSAWPRPSDQQNLTHTGDILGTLRYMPPEAFEGKADAPRRRLRAGPDALRAAGAAAGVRREGPRPADHSR